MRFLMLLGLIIALAGCTNVTSRWRYQPQAQPAPPLAPTAPHHETPIATRHRPSSASNHEEARTPSRNVAPKPAVAAPEATTVSLGDDDGNRTRAQDLLQDADAKLAKINKSKLTREDAAAYTQASGLVGAARKAISDHDYLEAAGLAQKASVISGQLTSHAPLP
jgi:hypothetical protein